MNRMPWTIEELRRLVPALRQRLAGVEAEEAAAGNEVRPVGPLTVDEARDLLLDLVGVGEQRPLTRQEAFLHGQLLQVFQQAVAAHTLGYKGRFFVVPEESIRALVKGQAQSPGGTR